MSGIVRVFSDGIEIGSVPHDTLEFIIKDNRKDYSLWIFQAGVYVRMIIISVWRTFFLVPAVIFAICFLLLTLAPSSMAEMIEAVRSAPALEIAEGFKTVTGFAWAFSILVLLFRCSFGKEDFEFIGYKNVFREARDRDLKGLLETPVTGKLTLRDPLPL